MRYNSPELLYQFNDGGKMYFYARNSKLPEIHYIFHSIDIPFDEKIGLSRRYSEDVVKNAIKWATSAQNLSSLTLCDLIKLFCQNDSYQFHEKKKAKKKECQKKN